jgi:hypothetical protein
MTLHAANAWPRPFARIKQRTGRAARGSLASLQNEIDKSADIVDAVSEIAAKALLTGRQFDERGAAWKAKERRDKQIEELALLKTGLVHLRGQVIGAEKQAEAELMEVREAREPLVQAALTDLADALAETESAAATLRARLYGFSTCSHGPQQLQKLPPHAIALLRSKPANAREVMLNSPEQRAMNRERELFKAWKRELETNAQAQLDLGKESS